MAAKGKIEARRTFQRVRPFGTPTRPARVAQLTARQILATVGACRRGVDEAVHVLVMEVR